jgi:hypothetical protein
MRTLLVLCLAVAPVFVGTNLKAAQIVQTGTFSDALPIDDFLSFTAFDTHLGTLNFVQLGANTTIASAVTVTNNSGTDGHYSLSDTVNLGIYDPFSNLTLSLGPTAYFGMFVPDGQTVTSEPQTATDFNQVLILSGLDAWSANGPQSISVEVYGSDFLDGEGPQPSTIGVDSSSAAGSLQLTYDYAPVPEPSTTALAGGAMLLFGFWARRLGAEVTRCQK